jgi:hypothetical protein
MIQLQRKREEILQQWKADKLSLIETIRALVDTGVTLKQAFAIVQRT